MNDFYPAEDRSPINCVLRKLSVCICHKIILQHNLPGRIKSMRVYGRPSFHNVNNCFQYISM